MAKKRIAIFYFLERPLSEVPLEQMADYASFGIELKDGIFTAGAYVRADLAPEDCNDLEEALNYANPREGESVMNTHAVEAY